MYLLVHIAAQNTYSCKNLKFYVCASDLALFGRKWMLVLEFYIVLVLPAKETPGQPGIQV